MKLMFIVLVFKNNSWAKCHHCPNSITTVSGSAVKLGEICQGQLLFEDDFNDLDENVWQHEITVGGGGVSLIIYLLIYELMNIMILIF